MSTARIRITSPDLATLDAALAFVPAASLYSLSSKNLTFETSVLSLEARKSIETLGAQVSQI